MITQLQITKCDRFTYGPGTKKLQDALCPKKRSNVWLFTSHLASKGNATKNKSAKNRADADALVWAEMVENVPRKNVWDGQDLALRINSVVHA
jgi:hypothetical protein